VAYYYSLLVVMIMNVNFLSPSASASSTVVVATNTPNNNNPFHHWEDFFGTDEDDNHRVKSSTTTYHHYHHHNNNNNNMTSNVSAVISKKNNSKKTRMPPKYIPNKNAVLCGRGKTCTTNPGNRRLRSLIRENLEAYGKSNNKVEKTEIVSRIMDAIKIGCPSDEPSFLKKEDGIWYEVDDAYAREKIGCVFRDQLYTKYRSSTKAKLARRKQQIAEEEEQVKQQKQQHLVMASTANAFVGASSVSSLKTGTTSSSEPNHLFNNNDGMMMMMMKMMPPQPDSFVVANRDNINSNNCVDDALSVLATLLLEQEPAHQQQPLQQPMEPPLKLFHYQYPPQKHPGGAIAHSAQQRRDLLNLCPNMIGLPGGNKPIPMEPSNALNEAFGLIQQHQTSIGRMDLVPSQQHSRRVAVGEEQAVPALAFDRTTNEGSSSATSIMISTDPAAVGEDGDLPDDISGIFD
jgi:hypothetical protein